MQFLRFVILLSCFTFSFARAACDDDDDFEIFANEISLGCDESVQYEITYGDTLTLSVSPANKTYEWLIDNTITIIKTGSSFSPKFSENQSNTSETYLVRQIRTNDTLEKTIEVTVNERPSYTVSFDTDEDDNATEIEPQIVMKDDKAKEPEETLTLTKTDYDFKGWDFNFNTPITKDTTIKAIWKIQRYLVIFDTGEDDNATEIEPQIMLKGELAQEPKETLTKTGYDFMGWDFDFNTPITKNYTIHAIWKIKTYTVSFSDGDSIVEIQSVDYNSKATPPKYKLIKPDYDFVGWDFDFSTPITKNDTIYAEWVTNSIIFTKGIYEKSSQNHSHYFVASVRDTNFCPYPPKEKIENDTIQMKEKQNKILKIRVKVKNNIEYIMQSLNEDSLYKIPFPFDKPFSKSGLDTLILKWISYNGLDSIFDTILVKTPIPFDTIVKQKWNNSIMFVNNNPKTNGGYEFTDFNWFKINSEKPISKLQFYQPSRTDINDTIKVVMTTADGVSLSTCESPVKGAAKAKISEQTPKKRIKTTQVLGIREKSLNPNSKIYNLNGKLTKETPAGVYIVEE